MCCDAVNSKSEELHSIDMSSLMRLGSLGIRLYYAQSGVTTL